MTIVFLFPGQGTQYPRMIRPLSGYIGEIGQIISEASDITHIDIGRLCSEADAGELMRTENAQVVILTMSVAYLKILSNRGIVPDIVAGHSLGEYSAFVASGCLSFEETLKIVAARGKLMAGVKRKGCMYAIVGLDKEVISEVCDSISSRLRHVSIALYNTPNQIIIGGDEKAVGAACEKLKAAGALRIIRLSVSNAFHTEVMSEIVDRYAESVGKVELHPLSCRIVLNCTGNYAASENDIRKEMIRQCTSPVMWEQSIRRILKEEDPVFAEVGVGKTLSGMMRSIDRSSMVFSLESGKQLAKFIDIRQRTSAYTA